MRSKVCGLNSISQLIRLDEMEVEFGGFIFYPKSPRYILKHLQPADLKNAKGQKINKVGVFVNETIEQVLKQVDDCGLYLVQLHGDESPKYCEKIADYVTVIKAFRIRNDDDVLWKIKDYQDIVDMFLFDTAGASFGGTGEKFDWTILKNLTIDKPFFLSGGIGPEDVASLQAFSESPVAKDLFSIDINSKFETSPGIKNMDMVESFIHQIKRIK
jgi:phosphoribosylanthranilate isomerase